jgi:hypothetical protein
MVKRKLDESRCRQWINYYLSSNFSITYLLLRPYRAGFHHHSVANARTVPSVHQVPEASGVRGARLAAPHEFQTGLLFLILCSFLLCYISISIVGYILKKEMQKKFMNI